MSNRVHLPTVLLLVLFLLSHPGCASTAAAPSRVTFRDGQVLVNGRPTIIYGTYRDPSDNWREFSGIRQAGFNLTHSYHFAQPSRNDNLEADLEQWITDAREYLRLAHENNVGVFLEVPRALAVPGYVPVDSDSPHADVNLSAEDQVRHLTRIVNAVKDEPALWFWYLADEPALQARKLQREGRDEALNRFINNVRRAYQTIKELDPHHPVVIVDPLAPLLEFPVFVEECCDTIWPDVYGRAYSTLNTARAVEVLLERFGKPVVGVPHGGSGLPFVHRRVRGQNPERHPAPMRMNDRTIENKPRYLRAYLHSMIAAGSPGLVFYWSPTYEHNMTVDTPEQWRAICELGKEVKLLEPILLSQEPVEGVTFSKDHWGAFNRAWELYGQETMTREEIVARPPLMWWKRQYEGSVYVGVATDHVPTQRVSLAMPFDIERVVVVNENLPILQRNPQGTLVPDQRRTPVAIWGYSDKGIEFLINQGEAVVLRFDPRTP